MLSRQQVVMFWFERFRRPYDRKGYMRKMSLLSFLVLCSSLAFAEGLAVKDIQARFRNGQTFITWKDAAEKEAGASYRYSLYRSDKPITQENLTSATCVMRGLLNNSAKLFGSAFRPGDRLDPQKPTCRLEATAKPLPLWSGLAVWTAKEKGSACYAVVATDLEGKPLTKIVPGESATTQPVEEEVQPLQPVKLYDSKERGRYWKQTCVTGKKGMPLTVVLHASNGRGGGAGSYGDYYLYFATADMGYRDGLPGVFSVKETHLKENNRLVLENRDIIVHPSGKQGMETYWFGYVCVPQGATHSEPRAYPFTERRLDWIVSWVVEHYGVDPKRIICEGGSMGAWGSTSYGLHRPQRFAAVYPNRPRTIQRGLPSLAKIDRKKPVLMDDGKTDYFTRMNSVRFVAEHPGDLPFYGWCCGRRDGFATWKEQIEMVKALTAGRHGFAFAWNDGDHSSGSKPMGKVKADYPATLFALDQSYPAFGNSFIDQNMGNGDPKDGDLEGGINLGFKWKVTSDTEDKWSVTISTRLCKAAMTVDVTPRRLQLFKVKPSASLTWTASTGDKGEIQADANGRFTVEKLKILPGKDTELSFVLKK